jgi:hypothetical protein
VARGILLGAFSDAFVRLSASPAPAFVPDLGLEQFIPDLGLDWDMKSGESPPPPSSRCKLSTADPAIQLPIFNAESSELLRELLVGVGLEIYAGQSPNRDLPRSIDQIDRDKS